MAGAVDLFDANSPNSLHEQLRNLGSGDPSICTMHGNTGESTTARASTSEDLARSVKSARIADLVDHET
jgi:hypothetical protein